MYRIASLLLLQRLKESMSGDARHFSNMETRTVIKFFSCKVRRLRKFTPFWQKHLGNMHHRMPKSKTGWPSLNMVIFSSSYTPRPGRPQTLTTPVIIYHIQGRRISVKSVAEQLGISREWVGSIIHEDLDVRKLSAKWVPQYLNADPKRQWCQSSEQLWNFLGTIIMISCRDCWLWTKPGYISMTRRQSNNQWSGFITAHLDPKNPECKNALENFSPRSFGIKTASFPLIIFQRAKLSKQSITDRLVQLKDILKEKQCGKFNKGILFFHENAPAQRALATQKKLAYLGFQCLDHPPFLRIWPRRTSTCSLDWNKIESSPFFFRRGTYTCRGDLVGRTNFWIFFE